MSHARKHFMLWEKYSGLKWRVHTPLCQCKAKTLSHTLNTFPLATVMSHCKLKYCVLPVLSNACIFAKIHRSWAAFNCFVDLVKFSLVLSLSLSDSISVLRSLPIPLRWCKGEMTVSTGCFPLIDVVLSGSDPQKRHTFAPLIAHCSAKPR